MPKKNLDSTYTPATSGIVLDTKSIISGVVGTLVVGGIMGAFTYSRVTESNSYRITTNTQAIEKLQETVVTKEVYEANQETIVYKLDQLAKSIEEIKRDIR